MENLDFIPGSRALILGGTGFIGRRLVRELLKKKLNVKLLVRSPEKVDPKTKKNKKVELITGDLLKDEGLQDALEGVHSAFYLVHSMGGRTLTSNKDFISRDRKAARNFIRATESSGLKRIIYLGGLGETGPNLSEHLRSRAEIAKILSSGTVQTTVLRAAVIIGAGGASFEMLRYLVERLPVMICPKWIDTKIQPIAVRDVISYLAGCLMNPRTAGKTFDIGGPEVLTYREMMHQYADARGLARRLILTVPVLTPLLASYWVDLVTPVPSGIAHPLIEGLKNEVVCRDDSIDEHVHVNKTSFKAAVMIAFKEEETGPGITGF
jgi:uncharacterized protein YbjT (DUF2867 family)